MLSWLGGCAAALDRRAAATDGELTARIDALQAEVERLTRGAKRQAAPFSKGHPGGPSRSPWAHAGAGPFRYHEPLHPRRITTPPVDVKVTLARAPPAGGT